MYPVYIGWQPPGQIYTLKIAWWLIWSRRCRELWCRRWYVQREWFENSSERYSTESKACWNKPSVYWWFGWGRVVGGSMWAGWFPNQIIPAISVHAVHLICTTATSALKRCFPQIVAHMHQTLVLCSYNCKHPSCITVEAQLWRNYWIIPWN